MIKRTEGAGRGALPAMRIVALVAALLLIPLSPANACSCAMTDPREALEHAEAAFAGTMLSVRDAEPSDPDGPFQPGREVIYTFEVERDYKVELGEQVEVHSSGDGGTCGISASPGEPTAMFLYRHDSGPWRSNSCSQLSPAELQEAAEPLPVTGQGPVRFLAGGAFGPERVVALDAQGRPLAYGYGAGETTHLSACPGGAFAAEVVADGREPNVLVVRRLSDFSPLWEMPIPFDLDYETRAPHVQGIRCRDDQAERIVVGGATKQAGQKHSRLVSVSENVVRPLHQGTAAGYHLERDVAFISTGRRAKKLKVIDLDTQRARHLAALRPRISSVALSPDGRRAAVLTSNRHTGAYLHVINMKHGLQRSRAVVKRNPSFDGAIRWQGRRSFTVLTYGTARAITFDSRLTRRGAVRWPADGGVVWRGQAYGLRSWSPAMYRADLPRGETSHIASMVSFGIRGLELVPGHTTITFQPQPEPSPDPTPTPEPTPTAEPTPTPTP